MNLLEMIGAFTLGMIFVALAIVISYVIIWVAILFLCLITRVVMVIYVFIKNKLKGDE